MKSPLLGYNTNVRHRGKLFHIQTEDSGVSHGHIFTHLFADGGRIIATKKSSYSQWIGTDRYPAVVKKLMQAQHKAMFIALRDGLFDQDEIAGAKAFSEREIVLDDETPPTASQGTAKNEPDAAALDRAAAAYLSSAPSFVGEPTVPGAPAPPQPARPESATPSAPSRARLDPTPVAGMPIQAPRPASSPSVPRSVTGAAARPPGAPTPATSSRAPEPGAARPPSGQTPRVSGGRYQPTQPAAVRRPSAAKRPAEPSLFGADILSEKSLDEVIMSYLAEDLDEKE